jgi:ribosomal protein S20
MKKLSLILLALICFGLFGGCQQNVSRDAEVSEFLSEWETVTREMSAKLETGDVDAAQQVFDAKKAALKKKWEVVKTARGNQVSKEMQKKMDEDARKNITTLNGALLSGSQKKPDRPAVEKMQALYKEYQGLFKM